MYIRLKFNLRANRIPERGNPANPAQNQLANIVNPTAMLLALLESTTFIRQIAMSSCLIGLVLLYFTPPVTSYLPIAPESFINSTQQQITQGRVWQCYLNDFQLVSR